MVKARTLVDDFGYIADDGTRLSHPAGTIVELDQDRFDELVEAGSVEPADAPKRGRGKKADASDTAVEAGSVEPADDDTPGE